MTTVLENFSGAFLHVAGGRGSACTKLILDPHSNSPTCPLRSLLTLANLLIILKFVRLSVNNNS